MVIETNKSLLQGPAHTYLSGAHFDYYGLNCVLPPKKRHIEALNPKELRMWPSLETGSFQRKSCWNEITRVGLDPPWLTESHDFRERKPRHQRNKCRGRMLCAMKAEIKGTDLQAKQPHRQPAKPWELGERQGTGSPSRPQKESASPMPRSWTPSLQNWEMVRVCCLRHSVCGTRLQQP